MDWNEYAASYYFTIMRRICSSDYDCCQYFASWSEVPEAMKVVWRRFISALISNSIEIMKINNGQIVYYSGQALYCIYVRCCDSKNPINGKALTDWQLLPQRVHCNWYLFAIEYNAVTSAASSIPNAISA